MIYGAKIMWIKTLTQSVGLTCLMGLSSCDKVQGLVGDITGSSDPQERRVGISKLHEASASDVREWLAEPNVLVVLDFYSDSCPPCIAMMPALHKMAEKYGDKAAVLKLNVGNKGEVATMAMDEYKITKTPILKFYLNGKEVKELVGAQSEEELDVIFNKYTQNIDTELVLKEGEMPGQRANRTVEEMIVRPQKGEPRKGITREKIPKNAKSVTEGLPENILQAGAPAPVPTIPAKD